MPAVNTEIQARLPDGMRIDLAYDSSVFIEASIDNVYQTLLEAGCWCCW